MSIDTQKNGSGRQRLAWTILLGSFAVCMAVTIAVPLTGNAYLQNATDFLNVTVQANQGTVRIVDESNVSRAVSVGQSGQKAFPGDKIRTDAIATALIAIYPPDSEQLLARLQVYGNSDVSLEQANAPRFEVSDAEQTLTLVLDSGRLRLSVPEQEGRPFRTTITTPQGAIHIEDSGQYSLEVNNEATQVTVQDGRAHVVALDHFVDLVADQRSVIPTGEMPSPPLGTERNLIQNGDFSDGWDKWRQYVWKLERPEQPAGRVTVEPINGEPTLYIRREGIGAAEVEARQTINQTVTDFETVSLEIDFRIVNQSLAVCGSVGSECPLTIRIDYKDANGNSQVWWQGFYSKGDGGLEGTPDVCETCPSPRFVHQKVAPGQIVSYQFNLIEGLKLQAFLPPSRINSISLLASGHSFEVEVLRVALLVEEGAGGK